MKKHGFTILVVEDDPNDQTLIAAAFQTLSIAGTVHIVSDGAEAIDYMTGEGKFSDRGQYPYPTFIMTDLKMPRADGFAVLEHLKANPAWATIPAVVLSASTDPDDIRTSYLLGASAYHSKPTSFDELCHQLKTLYDYWMTCHLPDVEVSGKHRATPSKGKLGERFPQPHHQKQSRT